MYDINNFLGQNSNIKMIDDGGAFQVIEFNADKSVTKSEAMTEYFASQMNIKRRQVVCDLSKSPVRTQAGAMQWMLGNVQMVSGVKSIGSFLGNALKGMASGESIAKPEYKGDGLLVLEPTYKHLIVIDVGSVGGGLVVEDGMFLASEQSLSLDIVSRKNLSSAILGGEGLFNLCLRGNGMLVVESDVPYSELIQIKLNNDTLKIDGNNAVMWSDSLDFTVEKSTISLIGSALSGEGLVNVYRGTGTVFMAPLVQNNNILMSNQANKQSSTYSQS